MYHTTYGFIWYFTTNIPLLPKSSFRLVLVFKRIFLTLGGGTDRVTVGKRLLTEFERSLYIAQG